MPVMAPAAGTLGTCSTKKRRWQYRGDAEQALLRIVTSVEQAARRPYQPVAVYRCRKCHGWHLTSSPARRPL